MAGRAARYEQCHAFGQFFDNLVGGPRSAISVAGSFGMRLIVQV